MRIRRGDLIVGLFMLLAALALIFLALKVSGLAFDRSLFGSGSYRVSATFGNIGDLKIRAPVRIAGVQIGKVTDIELNKNYSAVVTMDINSSIDNIPVNSSASVVRSSLLGDNYVGITPGYAEENLKNGSKITTTYSATSLESLISTFMGSGGKK